MMSELPSKHRYLIEVRSKMESEECELAMLMEMYAHPACGPSSHKVQVVISYISKT